MNSAHGTIVSVAPGHATVSVDAAQVCARCAAGKGCGAGLLTGANQARLIDVEVAVGLELRAGDKVRLTLAPAQLLRAAVFAYGLPLLGVIAALAVAWFIYGAIDDGSAVVLAMAGLLAGALSGRYFLNQDRCLKNLVPTVSKTDAHRSDL
ncbi:MAG: SoxR reducing system RseC family protein [Woeseia sp.]